MLEGLVAPLLNRFLGMYIRNFDPTQLRLSVWSGDVKLQNLDLRREALDQLHLPINVVEGHIGTLRLSIPWSNLKGKAVEVFIEDVYLLAAPKEDAAYDDEEEDRRQQAVKMEKLESVEMLRERTGEGSSPEEQQKNQSFTQTLVTKIVDNLQVTIKNIHIRYEDSISAPGHPFALGVTLEEFSAVSTDGEWKPAFINTSTGVTHKLATLGALAVYWNTDTALLGTGTGTSTASTGGDTGAVAQGTSRDDMFKKFHEMIVKGDSPTPGQHQFLLRPVSGRAKIEMDKSGRPDKAKMKASLLFDEIGFVLDDDQYRDALMMIDLFHYFILRQEYKKLQPKGVTPKEDPRAWLRFAIDAVVSKIHDKNRRWSWAFMKERRDNRVRYIELFKQKKKEQALSPTEIEELTTLEKQLSYEDLRFWRSLARSQLRKENALVKKADDGKQAQGWGEWIFGPKKNEETTEESTIMTEEQREELYKAIDWSEKDSITASVDAPRDSIRLEIEASLKTGSFTLKRDPHGKANEVLSLLFDGFKAKMLQRPDSFLADLGLDGLRVYDGTTPGSLYPQIVSVKGASSAPDERRIEELKEDADHETDERRAKTPIHDPFFQLQFEKNPLDGHADTAVSVKLKSMEVIYSASFIVGIAKFFKPPERHMESITALMDSAGATVDSFRQQTRAGLEFALQEHKTIDAKLDLQAPVIIVPGSVTRADASCLILDAGHISLESELISKDTIRDVQSKQKHQLSEEDFQRLEGLMYDKFRLRLKATQVLIGPSIEATKSQLEIVSGPKDLHIVDRINIDFVVETCILPKAPNLTRMRVSGHLPILHASVSDLKYKSLMKLIDVAIPKFEEDFAPHETTYVKEESAQSTGSRSVKRALAITEPNRARSKSFQFSAMEESLILDDDPDEETQEGPENFEDALEGVGKEESLLKQRNFELKFTVDKLRGSLFMADPEARKPDKLLAELIAEHFQLDFLLRPFDMTAVVSLKTLMLEDHVEPNAAPEFKHIVSSEGFNADQTHDLFHVKFSRINQESPEFMTVYDAIETNVDVSVSTINLVVTRATLLTLLDFVLLTFTNPDPSPHVARPALPEGENSDAESAKEVSEKGDSSDTGKIRVKVDLKSIVLILNDDGVRLATLSLNKADVEVFLNAGTMRVGTRLGDLSLLDEIDEGASEESSFRQLVTIEGDDLADFSYETFDAADADTYPGHDSSIYLRSGSVKVNFIEEPFRKIIDFMVKFGRMQALFNAARQAALNQANSIQNNAGKMRFDIVVMTPIVVFPRVASIDRPKKDLLTAYLGEIYASNAFVPLDDSEFSPIAMKLSAGIRNIRLTSDFHYDGDRSEELELLNKVDLGFKITYMEHQTGFKRPDLEIEGSMSDLNLRLTQSQLRFLLDLSTSVPAAFAGEPGDGTLQIDPTPSTEQTLVDRDVDQKSQPTHKAEEVVNLGPELGVSSQNWTKLDLVFRVGTIALELTMGKVDEPVGDLESASLSKASLNETNLKLRMISDGSIEAELLIQSFTIRDSRTREKNKFRKVMSSTNNHVQQFMASVTISGGQDRSLIAILTIDSPRFIFALDYLFALQTFSSEALAGPETTEIDDPMDLDSPMLEDSVESLRSLSTSPVTKEAQSRASSRKRAISPPDAREPMSVSYRVNIVEAQVILIANPAVSNSEAIVLGTKQILLSQQHALTLEISKVGMFLCRMDEFETTRLRILDDLTLQMTMDSRSKAALTSVSVELEPLVLRLSLRDILLALQIVNKASELSGSDDSVSKNAEARKVKDSKSSQSTGALARRTNSGRAPSSTVKTPARSATVSRSVAARSTQPVRKSSIVQREELIARLDGLRVVLIGDLHELPLLDLSVKPFQVGVRDWSSQMKADTHLDMFANVYNFSKSAWEPLIEPWQVGFHMSKERLPDCLSVDLFSRKNMEVTVTAATIALALKSAQFLQQDEDVLSKPRGAEAPYRIRNQTGYDLDVWVDEGGEDHSTASKVLDGEEVSWRFEDWEKMRENLASEGTKGNVGICLKDSPFDSIRHIPMSREGEKLYSLRPKKDDVSHRLLVEVILGADNVKYVTFRSPLLVENKTQIPVEMGVYDVEHGHLVKIEKIPPGESRPAPIGAAYEHSLLIRPDQGFGYSWSSERMFWRDLLKRPTRTMTCKGEDSQRTPSFYFQMSANYDTTNPLTTIYPYMRLRLSAPVELLNLLPYDFKYRVYDKNTKRDWTNFLRHGGLSPVHVVELSHLLLLSIHMQDTVYNQSEFAIINANSRDDFRRETSLVAKDDEGLMLKLKLHYFQIPDSGGAFRVAVYSPYVILNKTGLDIDIKSKSLLQGARAAPGKGMRTSGVEGQRKALPYMFSYASDDRSNRAILKIGESNWSKPQSFEAIGSTAEVVLPSLTKQTEIHVGISVEEGEGKYKMTKVVTLAPRFILKSKIGEEIQVREPGSSSLMKLGAGQLLPLHFLRQRTEKQLCLCFPGLNNQWSSPFNISDLGSVHVKLAKTGSGQAQQLIRVEILLEQATIFLHLSLETKNWPFSMRNETDSEFTFFQANPNIDEDGGDDDHSGWRPVRYRLPPRSIMPYAWDYPAAGAKEIILNANGKERHVKLAEIGNLIPMKIPAATNSRQFKIVDLNVAADGPTQTLILSNYKASKSLYKQKSSNTASSQSNVANGFEVKEIDTNVTFKASIRFAGVGVSLINAQLKELAYITLRDIEFKYSDSPLYQTVNTTIKWIQIDNQLYGGIFPLIFYPSVVPKTGKEMDVHPILHAMVTRVKDDSYGVQYIKYATILFQQMTLEIDEDFVFALLDFSKVMTASGATEEGEGKLCDKDLDIPEPKQADQGQDIYFELLHIQPAQLDLSFVRTERVNVEDKTSSRNPLMFFLNILTMAIGNINDAPVRLNALMLENARVSFPVLSQHIQSHYSQEFLYQVHKILGSADFLGNPVGLFNNISSGVADIFYEPYQGLVLTDRPQEFGIGIAKGATSFVKKSVFGVSDSFSKVTGSISKGLAAATLDKQFQDRRRTTRARNRPKHALYGVTAGANSFVTSVASGVGGLARKPLEGAEREGLAGFIKGVGKGVVGLATKPAIGIFDLASNVSEGIRNTTTVFDADGLDRVRLTRFVPADGIVRPYSQREALGQFWLKQLDHGKYFNESYLAHLELPRDDVVVLLTYDRIMLAKSKKLSSEWDIPLKEIQTIAKERGGLAVTLKGGTNGPFIPVVDEGSRGWLYGMIGVAVRAFNEKYRAAD